MAEKEYIERNALISKLSEIPVLKDNLNLLELCKEWANSIPAADVIPRKNLEDKLSYLRTRCTKGVGKYFDKGMYGVLKIVSVREKKFSYC